MRTRTLLTFLSVNLAAALLLGVLTIFTIRSLTDSTSMDVRLSRALEQAKAIEGGALKGSLERYHEGHPDSGLFRNKAWIVGMNGETLSSNNEDPLPLPWDALPKPDKAHELGLAYQTLGLSPSATVFRLDSRPAAFLVTSSQREGYMRKRNILQAALFCLALAFSVLFSMVMTFWYLRIKSREAREVLLRLERGDLKARFQIRQFDEMGNLMLDFNRMAGEIERLVGKLVETELARKTLFQELSHDLRTPLTSLRTSTEALVLHGEDMPPGDPKEILAVCQLEIRYFQELLENLLFIAQMEEPKYKSSTETIELTKILESEVRIRQTQELGQLPTHQWELDLPAHPVDLTFPGDSHLIRRLIKNALENAARFAKTRIRVALSVDATSFLVSIHDDGMGMSPEQIGNFGKARPSRIVNDKDLTHVSLGLGSIIMRKIVSLYKGELTVQSTPGLGTTIAIRLPKL